MSKVRSDGLVIRALEEDLLKTFLMGGVFHQFWDDKTKEIYLYGETSHTDQYLLMPGVIFDNWIDK